MKKVDTKHSAKPSAAIETLPSEKSVSPVLENPPLCGVIPQSNIPKGKQTDDLTIIVDEVYPSIFPTGRIDYYVENDNRKRVTKTEDRLLKESIAEIESSLRKAGEVHKEVRSYIQSKLRPGLRFWDICCDLEDKVRYLIGENGPNAGMGFPTGVSVNHIAAHYTPNPGDTRCLHYGDVMKLDFGTEVNGYIIDSAFTVAFDPQFNPLLQATKDATSTGIREAGIDARLGELGGVIEEVINSYEVTIYGQTYPIVPIRNLAGHSIVKGSIHGNKCIPLVAEDSAEIMEEGEIFALETFATTGSGEALPCLMTSHYALNDMSEYPPLSRDEECLLSHITRTFNHLPFCRRWLDRSDGGSFAVNGNKGRQVDCIRTLNGLVKKGIVEVGLDNVYETRTTHH
ncbi:hypothetical protein JH06_4901 [Blastocystis sp. subtype 4]|uniref:hypothetical protein n=1 Tax=Blastocystis sp. subtype 4 TaxID=944170 RepID=UPI000711D253|nr:hypothetical protein JH06_4901 [Blastocystis sp. subtype 4]KNB42035.1 hypothetical protein JH06_4901 [Blastocystis sp. subtype 4]|eukprot:XP_014525478.1 hypothetical protein JH06_4901 [Blastocystis sp. subtype 4]